ncbi:unnamed protein product [Coccothraustes coccothraustes]
MGKGCGHGERWEGDRRSGGGADGSAAGGAAIPRGSAERWDREAAARAPLRRPSVRDGAGGEGGRGGRDGEGAWSPRPARPGGGKQSGDERSAESACPPPPAEPGRHPPFLHASRTRSHRFPSPGCTAPGSESPPSRRRGPGQGRPPESSTM